MKIPHCAWQIKQVTCKYQTIFLLDLGIRLDHLFLKNSDNIHQKTSDIERGAKKQYPKKAVHVNVAMKKAFPELAVVKKQHL